MTATLAIILVGGAVALLGVLISATGYARARREELEWRRTVLELLSDVHRAAADGHAAPGPWTAPHSGLGNNSFRHGG